MDKKITFETLKEILLNSDKPSVFFEEMRKSGSLLPDFKELADLQGVEQDPIFHPEGDAWVHTMQVIDSAAKMRSEVSDPLSFMLLALTHDFGKPATTEFTKGRIHSYMHEIKGVPVAERFLRRFTGDESVIGYVLNMIPLHMKPHVAASDNVPLKTTNRMYDAACAPYDLICMAFADKEGSDDEREFLLSRLKEYRETMKKPYVTEKDLLEAGVDARDIPKALAFSHKLRLAGIEKQSALRQTAAQIKSRK